MDLANQLFNFTLGVEPNKDTMQRIAGTLNSAGIFPLPSSIFNLFVISKISLPP